VNITVPKIQSTEQVKMPVPSKVNITVPEEFGER
jgi:hypothetical protein